MRTKAGTAQLPFALTDRDREILRQVFEFRILTSDMLQQLIPGSDQQKLRRLQKLTAHNYLTRHPRETAHVPYAYQVKPRAAEELADWFGLEPERVKRRAQAISPDKRKHALMISRLQFAVVRAVAAHPDIEIEECVLEDELPTRKVTYQEGQRVVNAAFKFDVLFILKYQDRYLALPAEADRSTERGKVAPRMRHHYQFWLQEREKARQGENAFFPFRVLWTARSQARMQSLLQYSQELDGGRGTGLHWFTTEDQYRDDPTCFFAPIWRVGKMGDEGLHHLLEMRERR